MCGDGRFETTPKGDVWGVKLLNQSLLMNRNNSYLEITLECEIWAELGKQEDSKEITPL